MPHPQLAEVYAHLVPGSSAEDRLARVKKLTKKARGAFESTLATARAAMEAQRFEEARTALVPHLGDPTQRACLLMAEIEASEHGDHGKAREWALRAMRARRDAAWVADGFVAEEWLPASPRTGKLDAFVWSAPPTAPATPMLEQAAEQALALVPAVRHDLAKPKPTEPAPASERRAAAAREKAAPLAAEPPLPDDPGPQADAEAEVEAEEAAPKKRFRFLDWLAGPAA
jgi:HemY protein